MSISKQQQSLPDSNLLGVLEKVLAFARANGMDQKTLAERAGIRAETITRAKSRGSVEWATVAALARAVNLDLAVAAVPQANRGRSSLADPRLALSWSNPNAPTETLIAKAIERSSFDLILRAAREHGIERVAVVLARMRADGETREAALAFADRALRNIAIGASRALHAAGH